MLLLIWIRNQKIERRNVTLRLPDIDKQRRARDFLKKWNFEQALYTALKSDIANILDPNQYNYFDEPPIYYTDSEIAEEYGPLKILKSRNLLEIVPLTKLQEDGNEVVSKEKINEIADGLALRSVVPIIQSAIGCESEWAKRFGSVLVYQALLNTFEHPDANMVFITMAKKPNSRAAGGGRLVIAVADNGKTISHTIADAYEKDYRTKNKLRESTTDTENRYKLHSNRIIYATWERTSRKPPESNPNRGMGLYYLKNLATEVGGEVIIRCENASVKFRPSVVTKQRTDSPSPKHVPQLSRGNIIRISIPLAS